MKTPAALIPLLLVIPLTGCLERTITIDSDPPGALVHLNDQEIGRTPVTTEFRYFGVYDVRVSREGYEPITTKREAVAPWYEYPGIDLFAIAAPWRITTEIDWSFDLEPVPLPGTPEAMESESVLFERARSMRDAVRGQ